MRYIILTVFSITFVAEGQNPPSITCVEKVGNCACKTDDGGWINLEPLDSGDSSNPKFQNIADFYSNTYSYNPCTAFSSGSCTDVSVCQTTGTGETFPLGTQDSAVFSTDSDWNGPYTKLTYTETTSDGTVRTSYIRLTCDPNTDGTLTSTGEGPTLFYDFELTTQYACSNIAPPAKGGGGGGLSVGSILLIVAVVLCFVYIAGFMLFNALAKGARGTEMLPHRDFWVAIPGLVKEGSTYTFMKIRGVATGKGSGYEEM